MALSSFGFIAQNEQFEDRNVASNNTSNYYVIEKGVFAYNPSRLNVGSLALKQNDKVSLVSPLYECFTTNQNQGPQINNYRRIEVPPDPCKLIYFYY